MEQNYANYQINLWKVKQIYKVHKMIWEALQPYDFDKLDTLGSH